MILESNKQYIFNYYKLRFSFDEGKSFIERQNKLTVHVPIDYDGLYNTLVFIEIKDINNFFPNIKKRFIRFIDKINIKGKYGWKLLEINNSAINIEKCPDMIVSSLNTFEHPKFRNWFLEKYCGLTNSNYIKINWKKWKDYELAIDYVNFLFYYRTFAENLYYEVNKRGIIPKNYTEWKELVNEQYYYNSYYKKSVNTLNQMHEIYLRDILKLW